MPKKKQNYVMFTNMCPLSSKYDKFIDQTVP